jgi:hypothetical protein
MFVKFRNYVCHSEWHSFIFVMNFVFTLNETVEVIDIFVKNLYELRFLKEIITAHKVFHTPTISPVKCKNWKAFPLSSSICIWFI